MSRPSRVAASTTLRAALMAPRGHGRVLGVFPSAVYAQLDDVAGRHLVGRIVALESTDAVRLPCAAVLVAHSRTQPFGSVRGGDEVRVGDGLLTVGPLTLEVGRWWRPRRPRAVTTPYDDARLSAVARSLPVLPRVLRERLEALVRATLDPVAAADDLPDAARAMVGLGAGLTPEGDDVLAGLLVALSATPSVLTQRLRSTVAGVTGPQTTTLSAALLGHAADGDAIPALVDFVDAMRCDHPTPRRGAHEAVVRLLAVGHTSGAALAHGAVAGARLAAAPHRARTEVA